MKVLASYLLYCAFSAFAHLAFASRGAMSPWEGDAASTEESGPDFVKVEFKEDLAVPGSLSKDALKGAGTDSASGEQRVGACPHDGCFRPVR